MKAVGKLLKASYMQFLRDKTALFFTFLFPIIFMAIFGMIWSGNDNFQATIGLVYNDKSQTSQAISQAFRGITVLEVKDGNQEDQIASLKRGDLNAVIVIPATIDQDIAIGQPANLTVYYDPSQTTITQVVLPMISQVVDAIDKKITLQTSLLQLKQESIQTHQMRNIDYLVPGIIGMSMLSTGLFCALPLVQQREKKILKRWSATPMSRSAVIYSQVIFRLCLALLQTVILIVLAYFAFGVQVLGNWAVLFGLVTLGTLTFISIGYVVASFARTEEGAMPVVQLIQFPMLFLSGIFFPISVMPDFLKPVINAMPLTYLGDSLRQVMIDATPFQPMYINLAVLGGWLVVCMLVSIKFFRWE